MLDDLSRISAICRRGAHEHISLVGKDLGHSVLASVLEYIVDFTSVNVLLIIMTVVSTNALLVSVDIDDKTSLSLCKLYKCRADG